jgi:hypothetical protein
MDIVTTPPAIRPGQMKGVVVSYNQPPPPPGGAYGAPQQPAGPAPANNLVLAILSIFCCWPLGIAAIVMAAQVNGKWARGDAAGAHDSAAKAKKFAIWAIIAGVVIWVLYVLFFVVLGVASNS